LQLKVVLFRNFCDLLVIFLFMPIQSLAAIRNISYIIMAVWALKIKRIFDRYNLHSGDDPQTGCLNDRLFDCGDRRRDSRLVYSLLATVAATGRLN